MENKKQVRLKAEDPPKGWSKLTWLGAGILWALSSVGAGVIFYGPRVAARYGYTLLWAIVVVIFFTWLIAREIGRYTIVSGNTIMDGYQHVPGPRNWPIWIFFFSHLIDIPLFVAGQAALAGSLAVLLAPAGQFLWTAVLIVIAGTTIVLGGFKLVNNVSSWLAAGLLVAALIMLARVFPSWGKLLQGFIPQLPKKVDLYFLIPWIGFLLIHGAPWFSYWVDRQGFGRGKPKSQGKNAGQGDSSQGDSRDWEQGGWSPKRRAEKLRGWVSLMSQIEGAGTLLAGLFAIVFYILGAQLLGNVQVAPGIGIGQQMASQFKDAWGPLGLWVYVLTAGIAFWTTVLDGQDGASRMITDLTQILTNTGEFEKKDDPWYQRVPQVDATPKKGTQRILIPKTAVVRRGKIKHSGGFVHNYLSDKKRLKNTYVIVLGTLAPIILLYFYNHPLQILSISGIIGAAITPIFTFLTLWLNRTRLPEALRPNWLSLVGTVAAGLFFTVIIVLYLLHLVGINFLQ